MFEIKNIRSVIQEGFRGFMFLEPKSSYYDYQQRTWFRQKHGVLLPSSDELKKFGGLDEVRVLTEDVAVTIEFENSAWVQFKFYKGFLTDLASVPKFFRSVIDNDDNRLILAALVHDYLFTTHGLPFYETNELFYQIARFCGYSKFKSWLAWVAVSSPVAARLWRKETVKRIKHTRKTAAMMLPRPVELGGEKYDTLERL